MARYTTPAVFYQSSIHAGTAVEVAYWKSLSWANRTNNNGNFELILPADSALTPFHPVLGGYVRLDPGDTIMEIEKREKICDEKGNFWWKLGGRPTQQEDDIVREAKNNGFFFRYIYNGVNAETYSTFTAGTPVTTVNKGDIIHSSIYEDNLGGFLEEEMIDPGKPEQEAFGWSCTVVSQPKPIVTSVPLEQWSSVFYPNGGNPANGMVQESITVRRNTHNVFTGDQTVSVSSGQNFGRNGRHIQKTSQYGWFTNDITRSEVVLGAWAMWFGIYGSGYVEDRVTFNIRTVSIRSDAEMRNLMMWELEDGYQPRIPAVPPTFRRTYVEGGHAGYNFRIKSKGEVEKRYKVDFNLGDTIAVNDTRLNVVYTGVVSGAVETIDGNGYSVEIEIGTLGATLEQRVQRVI